MIKNNMLYKWGAKALLVVGGSFALSACEVIDIAPVSDFTDNNFWKNRVHAEASVIGIYDGFQALGANFIAWGEARGDLLQAGWGQASTTNQGGDFGMLQKNEITDANRFTQWGALYNAINRANVVIQKVPEVVVADAEFQERDGALLIGEARYLRAMAYFWLARVWKDAPLITEPTTANMDFMVRRTSQEKILTFVRSELEAILGNPTDPLSQSLRMQWPNARQNSSRATIGAARALLAQVALWQNDYDVVIDQTTRILQSNIYPMVSGTNWYSNFNPGITSEIISQILYDGTQNDQNVDGYQLARGTIMTPSTYLRDLHENPNNITYRDNVRGNGRTWAWLNAVFYKFVGTTPLPVPSPQDANTSPVGRVSRRTTERPAGQHDPNVIFFRTPDILLMRAEALNRKGQKAAAIADINVVRTRAALPPAIVYTTRESASPTVLTASASEDQIEDAILYERALELAGEGHRWFDLMRVSLRGRPNLLPTYVNDGAKYSFSGAWEAHADPTARLLRPVSADPNTWYLPIQLQNKITNPNLLEPPL